MSFNQSLLFKLYEQNRIQERIKKINEVAEVPDFKGDEEAALEWLEKKVSDY